MNVIKTRFRNKTKDDILIGSLILYIKKEIVVKFNYIMIFKIQKNVWVQL